MRVWLWLLPFVLSLPLAARAATGELTVKLEHVTDKGGLVRVALYDRAAYALRGEHPLAAKVEPARSGETIVTFTGLTPGEYALKAMQDIHRDGRMHFFLGVPAEPYGFSNDPAIVLTQPSFDMAKISVGEGENVTILTLH